MRYQLGPITHVGDHRVAVISRIRIGHRNIGNSILIQGRKLPTYIIIKDKDHMVAFDTSGARIAWEEIERACPEAAAKAIDVF